VTLTNGRYEFRVPTGGLLVLAEPPEAGWRMETPPDEHAATARFVSRCDRTRMHTSWHPR
jgi:hypothetical protein